MKKSATKVIASLFCVVLLLSCLTFQVSAQTVRDVEYFDDGSYVVTELTVNIDNPFARTGKSGSKTSTYYGSNNKAYFAVTLTGQFNYTYGSSAKATGASTSVTVYDSSASYVTKSATYSGATATGTGTVKVNATSRTLTVKITCDKYGNLS